jgi:hypothetical protein
MDHPNIPARPSTRPKPANSSATMTTILLLLLLSCSLISTAAAEIINPQCSTNVCTLPKNECVQYCPRNKKRAVFQFGLRSNKKCVASKPGRFIRDGAGSADLPPSVAGAPLFDDVVVSNKPDGLKSRQALWPEYGPPNCFWGLCQFEGPVCILWCTESQVFYGSNNSCK